ncbi:Mre11 protein [Ostreococcus tauri]|uniref:Mre11 protein n=1 Tax=Ostreococcus tauri TaxID=70448 RepID=A0A1Y5ICG1_OSTTA|nr:Mre11 protein [Ostreococcus tauri]
MRSRDVKAKVAFVSDNAGTSFSEVNAIVFVVVTFAFVSLTLQHARRGSKRHERMTEVFETITLAAASLASMFAPRLAFTASCVAAGSCALYWMAPKREDQARAAARTFSFEDGVAMYRFTLAMLTVIAILAVDFAPFPRRLGKTETYGVSLMDVGGGSYIFSSAIVSRAARGSARQSLSSNVRKVLPVIVLGIVRLVTTSAVGYHSIESEYGRHWNFFFTLAAVRMFPFVPERALVFGVTITLAYQYILTAYGLSEWVLQAPGERNHSHANWLVRVVSMNREGICSVSGYYAIHLIGVHLGKSMSKPTSSIAPWLRRTAIMVIVFWCVALVLHRGVENISRRAANSSYVFWVVAFNLQVVIAYVAMTHMLARRLPTLIVPRLAFAVSRNQLIVFLAGNILTGIVNLSMDTIGANDAEAWAVMTVYVKPPDPNTLRVLVATDTHLGFAERDAVRKDDAFAAFEEIFRHAREQKCDCVFMAGDVFDVNKPSRETLVRCMDVLREATRGDGAVRIEVLSDTKENFPHRGIVNYEDPHTNVELPVFSIHGNHDDPAGERNLSAMDVLASAGVVNYFGKHALAGGGTGNVDLKPVLLRKGTTKVALYGLGYIRDNRLHQMFSVKGCVRWHRPAETEDCSSSSWFNVMLIHQNRAAHSKNAISERYLPSWLDFVIWGHEHECLVEPTESTQGFHISQPGSSVVTSLIEGEAKEKKICVLEVRSDPENPNSAPYWRATPIPLLSSRPFEFEQMSLASTPELEGVDAEGMSKYLENCVRDMIARATRKHKERHAPNEVDMTDRMNLPLIRLRVDYSGGFSTINPQRFGQKFVGVVANPHDILLFHKSQRKRTKDGMDVNYEAENDELQLEEDDIADGALEDQRRIDRLVREHLGDSDGLQLLTPHDLSAALDDFRLKAVQTSVNADEQTDDDVDNLVNKIYEAVKEQLKKPSKHKPVMDENTELKTVVKKCGQGAAPAVTKINDELLDVEPPTQKRVPARQAISKKVEAPLGAFDRGDESDDIIEDSDDEVIPLSNPIQKPVKASRATAMASTRAKRNAVKKLTVPTDVVSDSDDSFNVEDEDIEASAWQEKTRDVNIQNAEENEDAPTVEKAAPDDDSGDEVDDVAAPPISRRSMRGTQGTTQGTQNTWGRSRR